MAIALQKYFDGIKYRVEAGDGEFSTIDTLQIILPYIFNIKGYDKALSENDPAFVAMAEYATEIDGVNFDFKTNPATIRIIDDLTRAIQDVVAELDDNAIRYFNDILNNANEPTLLSLSENADFSSLLSRIGERAVINDTNRYFFTARGIGPLLPTDINNSVDIRSSTNWIGSRLISSIKELFDERIVNMEAPVEETSITEEAEPVVNYPTPESSSVENEVGEDDLPYEITPEDNEPPLSEPEVTVTEQEAVSELPFPTVEDATMPEPDDVMPDDNMAESKDDIEPEDIKEQDSQTSEEIKEESVETASDKEVVEAEPEAEKTSFEEQNHTLEEITSNMTNSEAVGFTVPENEATVDDKTFFEAVKNEDEKQTVESAEVKETEEADAPETITSDDKVEEETTVDVSGNDTKEEPTQESAVSEPVQEDVTVENEEILAFEPDEEQFATADDLPKTGRFAVKNDEPVVTSDEVTEQPSDTSKSLTEPTPEPVAEVVTGGVSNATPAEPVKVADAATVSNNDIINMLSGFTQESAINEVAEHPAALKWVKQNMRNCIEAVSINGLALEYVKKPNFFIERAAVKQNGLAIQFVKNQTSALQVEAIKQNPLAIYAIKKPSPAAILLAIRKNYDAIRYNQMPGLPESSKLPCDRSIAQGVCSLFRSSLNQHICNELVSIDPNNIRYIPSEYQTPRMCKHVVMEDPHTVQFIVNNRLTDKIQNMAIEGNPSCIGLIQHPSLDLCARAFELDKNTFDLIPKDIREQFVKDFGLDAPSKSDDAR